MMINIVRLSAPQRPLCGDENKRLSIKTLITRATDNFGMTFRNIYPSSYSD